MSIKNNQEFGEAIYKAFANYLNNNRSGTTEIVLRPDFASGTSGCINIDDVLDACFSYMPTGTGEAKVSDATPFSDKTNGVLKPSLITLTYGGSHTTTLGGSFANLYGIQDYKVWEFPHLAKFYVDANENRIDEPIFMLPHFVNLKIEGHENGNVKDLCIVSEGGNSVFGVFNNSSDKNTNITQTVNNLYFSTNIHTNSADVLFFLKPAANGDTAVYANSFARRSGNTKTGKKFKKLNSSMRFNLQEPGSNVLDCFVNEDITGVGFDITCNGD